MVRNKTLANPAGIEPTPSDLESDTLPLRHGPIEKLAETGRFELPDHCYMIARFPSGCPRPLDDVSIENTVSMAGFEPARPLRGTSTSSSHVCRSITSTFTYAFRPHSSRPCSSRAGFLEAFFFSPFGLLRSHLGRSSKGCQTGTGSGSGATIFAGTGEGVHHTDSSGVDFAGCSVIGNLSIIINR